MEWTTTDESVDLFHFTKLLRENPPWGCTRSERDAHGGAEEAGILPDEDLPVAGVDAGAVGWNVCVVESTGVARRAGTNVALCLVGPDLVVEHVVEISLECHGRRSDEDRVPDRQVCLPECGHPSRVPSRYQLDRRAGVCLTEVSLLVERRPGLHVGAEPHEETERSRITRVEPGLVRPVEKEAAVRVVPEGRKVEVTVGPGVGLTGGIDFVNGTVDVAAERRIRVGGL